MGKQIKDLGVLIIIVGLIMLILVMFALFSTNTRSGLYYIVTENFMFVTLGCLVCLLSGIIIRSIGKSKEKKSMQNNQQMFVQQPYAQQNMNYQQPQQPYTQQNVNYQQSQNPNYPNN